MADLVEGEDYDLFAYEAQRIVDQVVAQSLLHLREANLSETTGNTRGRFIESENEPWQEKSSVQWPTIGEFTSEDIGIEKIHEYIEKEWKTTPGGQDDCWLYAIDFIERKSEEFTDLYIYRVRYSIPTRRQPIPRFTASVYFTLDVSKVRPKNKTIEVSFVFDTMRVLHTPEKFRFRQVWLENIILLKEKLAHGIDF